MMGRLATTAGKKAILTYVATPWRQETDQNVLHSGEPLDTPPSLHDP